MKLTQLFQIIIATILSNRLTSADNILFLSLPYYGHINPLVKLAGELANYGHTSYIIITEKFSGKFDPVKNGVNFVITEEYSELQRDRLKCVSFLREVWVQRIF